MCGAGWNRLSRSTTTSPPNVTHTLRLLGLCSTTDAWRTIRSCSFAGKCHSWPGGHGRTGTPKCDQAIGGQRTSSMTTVTSGAWSSSRARAASRATASETVSAMCATLSALRVRIDCHATAKRASAIAKAETAVQTVSHMGADCGPPPPVSASPPVLRAGPHAHLSKVGLTVGTRCGPGTELEMSSEHTRGGCTSMGSERARIRSGLCIKRDHDPDQARPRTGS